MSSWMLDADVGRGEAMGLRDDVAKVLITEQELQARIAELGRAINATYTDDDRPLLVCVLKGALCSWPIWCVIWSYGTR